MLPATTQMGGLCFVFPDVCKTPTPAGPVPIPYPNLSQPTLAVNTAVKVLVGAMPVVTLKSQIPISSGDEAGTAGGVVSGVFIGPTKFSKGSSKVLIEGMPCVHLTSMTLHNGASPNNPAGAVIAPSQAKLFVSP
ncbi:MAG: DUF4150 domain-containing protein [Pirellulaceae bacterium]